MEDQCTEWKESWKDDYLKTICAFANTAGGIMTIGIDDHGTVVGVDEPEKLLKKLPDTIRNKMGIVPFVRIDTASPPYTVSILIQKAPSTVYLDGRIYVRSGSTTQMVSGRDLEVYMMETAGISWTDYPVSDVSISDLSPEAILGFKNMGRSAGRLTQDELNLNPEDLLDKLNLIKDGKLTRAAILLFHPDPGTILGPNTLKIGMFDGPELLYQDEFNGPLIFTANASVSMIMTKYTVLPVGYKGIVRTETSPYPEPAIREAVMNAIVHNDYSSHVPIQIKVSQDGLIIYNEGGLPRGWTLDRLMGQHKSLPRNPSIAAVFYRAGLIESFGRGISKIMSQFEGRHEYEPVFESDSGFSVEFKNEITARVSHITDYETVDASEKLILDYLAVNSKGTYKDISFATGLSTRQLQRVTDALLERGLVSKRKEGRVVVFEFNGSDS